MAKRVIQVPIDGDLLDRLDKLSGKQRRSRAELIREACRAMVRRVEEEEMDRAYREGYLRVPDDSEWGDLGVTMMAELLKDEEPW